LQKCEIGVILSDMSRHARPTPSGLILHDLHRTRQKVRILYNGTPILTPKFAPSYGGSEPPSNTLSLGPSQVLNPDGISIGSAVFAGLTSVADRQTDRQTTLLGL